ncbi:CRE-TAC-1 protein [Caenorhabditis remanei]|uniref:CRE-TAC-1 protein n=2 Tax=Caenorhabditis remanei TaxID=31234 RepID=E3MU00_CAERE|nr:CRE-TAC-1 protein [Caenorhabditis remanei]
MFLVEKIDLNSIFSMKFLFFAHFETEIDSSSNIGENFCFLHIFGWKNVFKLDFSLKNHVFLHFSHIFTRKLRISAISSQKKMDSTFTKEDGEETHVIDDVANEVVVPSEDVPIQKTEQKMQQFFMGFSRAEIIVMKHTVKYLTETMERLLYSNEFEVRRCATGEIVSQGRCHVNGAMNGNGGGASDEEVQKLLKERDAARSEAEKLHANYATLYAAYNQVREAANDIRTEFEDAREKLKLATAEIDEWQVKFMSIKENATNELERASREYEDLVQNHEENVKGLRLRAKRHAIELSSKNEEIDVLKKRVEELSAICDQLIEDVDLSDQMSAVSMDA